MKKRLPRPARRTVFAFLILGLCFGVSGCRKTVVSQAVDKSGGTSLQKDLLSAQEISVRQEMESIEAFVERSGWQMQETGTGLRYQIYHRNGSASPKIGPGDAVRLSYTLRLLNGSLIEEYKPDSPRTFILGKSDMIAGLAEALPLLRKGDRARILVPSHLAYGFSGDGSRVPARATLLFDMAVEDILIPPRAEKKTEQPGSDKKT